jgi:hypothetical protein
MRNPPHRQFLSHVIKADIHVNQSRTWTKWNLNQHLVVHNVATCSYCLPCKRSQSAVQTSSETQPINKYYTTHWSLFCGTRCQSTHSHPISSIQFNISLHLCLHHSSGLLPTQFRQKHFYRVFISPLMWVTAVPASLLQHSNNTC